MARSKKSSILSKSKKLMNTGISDVNSIFKTSSNAILGLASQGFKTLKSKRSRKSRSRRTHRRH